MPRSRKHSRRQSFPRGASLEFGVFSGLFCFKRQARAAGTAAPETDEFTGKMINPHNPEFITKVVHVRHFSYEKQEPLLNGGVGALMPGTMVLEPRSAVTETPPSLECQIDGHERLVYSRLLWATFGSNLEDPKVCFGVGQAPRVTSRRSSSKEHVRTAVPQRTRKRTVTRLLPHANVGGRCALWIR